MIKIDRSIIVIPQELENDNNSPNGELKRVVEYVEDHQLPLKKFDFKTYKIISVKNALEKIFFNKCTYCESYVNDAGYAHIEHWRPKKGVCNNSNHKGYYWLASNWDNLFIACQICNCTFKKNNFPILHNSIYAMNSKDNLSLENPLLINPCLDNPDNHLKFNLTGGISGLTLKGNTSIKIYGLDRKNLHIKRREAANSFSLCLETILILTLQGAENISKKIIKMHLESIKEQLEPESRFIKLKKDIINNYRQLNQDNYLFLKLIENL